MANVAVLLIGGKAGLERRVTGAAASASSFSGARGDVLQPQDRDLIDTDHEDQALLGIRGGRAPVRSSLVARHRNRVSQPGRREDAFVARLRHALLHRLRTAPASPARDSHRPRVKVWRMNGAGLVGKGCVGQDCSPGISLFGTGRSSIGQSGCPVTRSRTYRKPVLPACATASTCFGRCASR